MTIDYQKCIDSVNVLKCNNIDQWQSVIEELKLESENSINVEIPFLKERKTMKQQRLKQLLDVSDMYDARMLGIVGQLDNERHAVYTASKEIEIMYKFHKPTPEEGEFVQQLVNVPAALNSNVPDTAGTGLINARDQYELADQSIQAQTVMNEMISSQKKIQESIDNVQKSFEEKKKELYTEKEQLKEDITRLRQLINNEISIQSKNQQKIAELEGKISACAGKPTNIEKDCEPIRLRAAKLTTEIEIMDARTNLLHAHISELMESNQTPEQIAAYKGGIDSAASAAGARSADMYYVNQLPEYAPREDPKERKPISHLKEGLQEQENKKTN